ncbi:MAG: M15 family metallopeptidase, partial [Pseudomonadales bacterium]|nr:M15 family metallopeptidase [Pseudomonadales bacterium]
NNSSAFNGRAITGGGRWSMHAYGVAIDLNPLENPYISFQADGSARVLPPRSARYAVNRLETRVGKARRPGMVEPVVLEFARHGFYRWGGDWNDPIDYQHFEVGSRRFVEVLVTLDPAAARRELDAVAAGFAGCIGAHEAPLGVGRQRCAAQAIEQMEARARMLAP